MKLILLWALVALIGRAHGKCSIAPIVDDERSIAYACIHGDLNDLNEITDEAQWIEFSVSRIESIPDDAFSRFRNLRRLSFYNCHVHVISPDAFRGLERLDWLIFHGTRLHVVRATWFRHLPNLRRLIFDRCGLVHVEPDAFRMLPRLETLGLRDNDLDCLPIEELSSLRMLRTVRVDGNPWLCECRQQMERFFQERSIAQEEDNCMKGVYRNLQCMMHIEIPVVPPVFTLQELRIFEKEHATIHANEFQTSALTSLDRLPDKTTWIDIYGLNMARIPQYAFFRFGNSLRTLDLRDCHISVIEPGAFAGLHKLQRLTLIGNRFSTVGASWFRDLVGLQQLVLENNGIEQVERTAFWHLSNSLRHLDIRNNRLRCLPVEELAELRKLERLDATGNPWICECRRNLEKFLVERNIGFQISAGPCYSNENEIPSPVDNWHQTTTDATLVTGKVRWGSFEETITRINISMTPPTTLPPVIHRPTEPPKPPTYTRGMCVPYRHDRSHEMSNCSGLRTITELNVIPSTVHTIRIILSNIREIPAHSFSRFDGYLRRLELRDCGIQRIHHRAFDGLYNLAYLSLHSNDLESVSSDMFEGIPSLRHLDLSRNRIFRVTNDVFDALPYLMSLDVSENFMNCIGVEHMAQRLQYLRELKISGNPWSCLCASNLANFLNSRRIPYDRISLLEGNEECYATHMPTVSIVSTTETMIPVTLPPVPETTTVKETVEGNCTQIEDAIGLRYRCMGGNLLLLQTIPSSVVAIEFHEGNLPHLPADAFSRFPNLRELVIRNCGLRTIEPGAFNGLDNLEMLMIQDNPLVTIGSSCFNLKNLRRLDLRGNSVRFIAPGAFEDLQRLGYLSLEGNDLKCIYTSDLNNMPNIQIIEYSGNPLKWRCRVELEQYLETRKIEYTRIDNACEGKKLVRKLLSQDQTEGTDCQPNRSTVIEVRGFLIVAFVFLAKWIS